MEYNRNFKLTKKRKEILKTISTFPGLKNKDLAATLGVQASALSNLLAHLKEDNLVYCKGSRRNVLWYINDLFLSENPSIFDDIEIDISYNSFETRSEKDNCNENLMLVLIKNILMKSDSVHARIILNNAGIYFSLFTAREIVILSHMLNILDGVDEFSFNELFQKAEISLKKDLYTRYKDVTFYILSKYEDLSILR